ncbi:remodeling and spacing factor 1 isoform 6-T6 [Synchiropus picturatus]
MAASAATASSSAGLCPNYAVICSFLERYGAMLDLPELTFPQLERYLQDTSSVPKLLVDLHVKLLRKIGKSVSVERWEKYLLKVCQDFNSSWAWELEEKGYKSMKTEIKTGILKHLCECQFDENMKFKNAINEEDPDKMRLQPIGRDKDGQMYWYQLDQDDNVRMYVEEQDDLDGSSWRCIVRDRNDLAEVVALLKTQIDPELLKKENKPEGEDNKDAVKKEDSTTDEDKASDPVKSVTNGDVELKPEPSEVKSTVNGHEVKPDAELQSVVVANQIIKEEPMETSESKADETAVAESVTLKDDRRSNVEEMQQKMEQQAKIPLKKRGMKFAEDFEKNNILAQNQPVSQKDHVNGDVQIPSSENRTEEQKEEACMEKIVLSSEKENHQEKMEVSLHNSSERETKTNSSEEPTLQMETENSSNYREKGKLSEETRVSENETKNLDKRVNHEAMSEGEEKKNKLTAQSHIEDSNMKTDCVKEALQSEAVGLTEAQDINKITPRGEAQAKSPKSVAEKSNIETENLPCDLMMMQSEAKKTESELKRSDGGAEKSEGEATCLEKGSKKPESKTAKTELDSKNLQSEPSKEVSNAKNLESKSSKAVNKACMADSEATKVEGEATKAESEATKAESEATKAESEATKAESEASTAVSKAEKSGSEANKVECVAKKVKAEAKSCENNTKKSKSEAHSVEDTMVSEHEVTKPKTNCEKSETSTSKCETKELERDKKPENLEQSRGDTQLSYREESNTMAADESKRLEGVSVLSGNESLQFDSSKLDDASKECEMTEESGSSRKTSDRSPRDNQSQESTDETVCSVKKSTDILALDKKEVEEPKEIKTKESNKDENSKKASGATNEPTEKPEDDKNKTIKTIRANDLGKAEESKNEESQFQESTESSSSGKDSKTKDEVEESSSDATKDLSAAKVEESPKDEERRGKGEVEEESSEVKKEVSNSDIALVQVKRRKRKRAAHRRTTELQREEKQDSESDSGGRSLRRSPRISRPTVKAVEIGDKKQEKPQPEDKKRKEKDEEEQEEEEEEEEEEVVQKKPREKKVDQEGQAKPKGRKRRKTCWSNTRSRRKKKGSEEEGSGQEESEEESEEEEEEDDSDEDYKVERRRKRRNRNREKRNSDSSTSSDDDLPPNDDPCKHCGLPNHPELILLCDSCDNGYHTACLRPPLMVIPDGEWFCPPCQHKQLCDRLEEQLTNLDAALKKKERAERRKERLIYVGISLENIITPSVEPEELKPEVVKEKKESKKSKSWGRRSTRAKKTISYRFDEFDEAIEEAIEEDIKEAEGGGAGRGKDMSNITGHRGKDISTILQGEEGKENGKPAPCSAAQRKKKRRRLNDLDSDSTVDEEESEEEFCLSASSEEEFVVSDNGSEPETEGHSNESEEDSDGSQRLSQQGSRRTQSQRRSSRKRRRPKGYSDDEEEETDEDEEEDEIVTEGSSEFSDSDLDVSRRRSRRSQKKDVNYCETSESEGSNKRRKDKLKPGRLQDSSESDASFSRDTDDSADRKTRRRDDSSEEDSHQKRRKLALKRRRASEASDSDSSEESSEDDRPVRKRVNRIDSDDSEEEETPKEKKTVEKNVEEVGTVVSKVMNQSDPVGTLTSNGQAVKNSSTPSLVPNLDAPKTTIPAANGLGTTEVAAQEDDEDDLLGVTDLVDYVCNNEDL